MGYQMSHNANNEISAMYREKLCTADEAAKCVKSGDQITYAFFNGKPVAFDSALAGRKGELKDVKVYGAVTIPPVPEVLTHDSEGEAFTYNDFHYSLLTRMMKAQFPDRVSYAPLLFGETDWQTEHLKGPLHDYDSTKAGIELQDVHIMRTAPMDESGYFNFGINNACMLGWCKAKKVIVEVNKNMPVALGGSRESIHITQVDHIIEGSNEPMFELPNTEATDVDKKIAEHVFKYLYDGCCIQLGIGGMPNTLGI